MKQSDDMLKLKPWQKKQHEFRKKNSELKPEWNSSSATTWLSLRQTDFQSVAEDLTKSSLANLQSKSAVQDLSFLIKQGAQSPAEGSAEDSK